MYHVAPIAADRFALAIWDPSWNSYNNCYLTLQEQGWTLIDCGKQDHTADLAAAIREVGLRPQDIGSVILTHGHRDHVGGLALFVEAETWMSSRDASLVSEEKRLCLRPLDNTHSVAGLTVMLLGHHTPGFSTPAITCASFGRNYRPTDWSRKGRAYARRPARLSRDGQKARRIASNITSTSS